MLSVCAWETTFAHSHNTFTEWVGDVGQGSSTRGRHTKFLRKTAYFGTPEFLVLL